MDHTEPVRRARRIRPFRPAAVALFALLLVSGPAFAACSGTQATASTGGWGAGIPTMHEDMPMAGAKEPWAARPAYARENAATQEAYAFAIEHPQIVQWMPCFCGCEAMDHDSNLDCYFKHGQPGDTAVFEEHASFCDICVEITLARLPQLLGPEGTWVGHAEHDWGPELGPRSRST